MSARKDHCMCTDCLRRGWEGISERGAECVKLMAGLPVWGHADNSPLGTVDMKGRLDNLWTFLRLRFARHVAVEDGIGSHCLSLLLGSRADERLDHPCAHMNERGVVGADLPLNSSTDPDCQAKGCLKTGLAKGSQTRIVDSWRSCRHCPVAYCLPHLKKHLMQNERVRTHTPTRTHTHTHTPHSRIQALGVEHTQKGRVKSFVCNGCQSKVDEARHSRTGCASCEEVSPPPLKPALQTTGTTLRRRSLTSCWT